MAQTINLRRRGVMVVLSSPSGAGKSSITRALVQEERERLFLSISVTTRAKRSSEIEGIHYTFIDQQRFQRMRDGGELLEWAEVHGNLYGTPKAAVENALASGLDVLFDIDWQGTQQLVAALPADVVTVFILPPSMNELRARLERRAEDADTVISNRLSNAASEIGHWREYDYIVINDDLERALGGVRAILTAERLKRARQTGMADFISGLTAKP
jgi:guanylate kinase